MNPWRVDRRDLFTHLTHSRPVVTLDAALDRSRTLVLALSLLLAGCGSSGPSDASSADASGQGTSNRPFAPAPTGSGMAADAGAWANASRAMPTFEPAPRANLPRFTDYAKVPRPLGASFVDDSRVDIARRLITAGNFSAAESVLRTAVGQNPDSARARFYLALAVHKQKRYDQARSGFERAIESRQAFPEIDYAFHYYGWCLFHLGELDAARAAFEEHLARVPDEGDSHYAIGLIEMEDGRLTEAERRFRACIALQKDDPSRRTECSKGYARLGDVHLRRGELEAARDTYRLAVTLYPNHYEAWANLADALEQLGLPVEAERARYEELAAMERLGLSTLPVPAEVGAASASGDASSVTAPGEPANQTSPESSLDDARPGEMEGA